MDQTTATLRVYVELQFRKAHGKAEALSRISCIRNCKQRKNVESHNGFIEVKVLIFTSLDGSTTEDLREKRQIAVFIDSEQSGYGRPHCQNISQTSKTRKYFGLNGTHFKLKTVFWRYSETLISAVNSRYDLEVWCREYT